jgi:hypothetical protein
VGRPLPGRAIPPGFLGLGLEYSAIERYSGNDPLHPDPVLLALVRNLTPGQRPVLRIGGDTTDWTWWPLPGVRKPPWVRFTLNPRWTSTARAVAAALDARLLLGINLEADSRAIAATEADNLLSGIGRRYVDALELGNEPNLYAAFTWYLSRGRLVRGRPAGYGFWDFARDFTRVAGALPALPLAGPATGRGRWPPDLGRWLTRTRRVRLVTVHRFPLQRCFTPRTSPVYPTIARLLSPASTLGLAESVAPSVRIAHAHHVPLRVGELNTISCGAAPSVARSFASALWALDTLFQLARVGVDGVNVQTYPGATFELFRLVQASDGSWRASVAPEYYGLLLFAMAAPAGARLLRVAGRHDPDVETWATRAADGTTRVVVINERRHLTTVSLQLPGHGTATVLRLRAPSLDERSRVTLGGQSFGSQTPTGALPEPPKTETVSPSGDAYAITLPGAGAAMLTLQTRS